MQTSAARVGDIIGVVPCANLLVYILQHFVLKFILRDHCLRARLTEKLVPLYSK